MMDFAREAAARNFGIRRSTDARHIRELLLICGCLAALACVLVFWAWVRCQIVSFGYAEHQLQQQEQSLGRVRLSLIIQENTLKSPERIDQIARLELGMSPVRTYQLLVAPPAEAAAGTATTIALAEVGGGMIPPRRPAATN